jgi:hypothetical protein
MTDGLMLCVGGGGVGGDATAQIDIVPLATRPKPVVAADCVVMAHLFIFLRQRRSNLFAMAIPLSLLSPSYSQRGQTVLTRTQNTSTYRFSETSAESSVYGS